MWIRPASLEPAAIQQQLGHAEEARPSLPLPPSRVRTLGCGVTAECSAEAVEWPSDQGTDSGGGGGAGTRTGTAVGYDTGGARTEQADADAEGFSGSVNMLQLSAWGQRFHAMLLEQADKQAGSGLRGGLGGGAMRRLRTISKVMRCDAMRDMGMCRVLACPA